MPGMGEYLPKIIVLPLARTSSYLGAVLDSGISCSPFTRWAGNRSAEFSTFILEVYNHLTLIPVNYYTSIYYIFVSALILGDGNIVILGTYSPVPGRHDRSWGRPFRGVRRLVEVWGGWWGCGDAGRCVGTLSGVWGGFWRCREAGGGMVRLLDV